MANVCSTSAGFPFKYLDSNGADVNGTLTPDGSCIFPLAQCGPNLPFEKCCRLSDATESRSSLAQNLTYICFGAIIFYYVFISRMTKMKRDKLPQHQREIAMESRKKMLSKMIPSWATATPWPQVLTIGYALAIGIQVVTPIIMRNTIQQYLVVSERNALIASEAFLVPFREIFQFIEDVMILRVNYAIGAENKELTNSLVHWGIFWGIGKLEYIYIIREWRPSLSSPLLYFSLFFFSSSSLSLPLSSFPFSLSHTLFFLSIAPYPPSPLSPFFSLSIRIFLYI